MDANTPSTEEHLSPRQRASNIYRDLTVQSARENGEDAASLVTGGSMVMSLNHRYTAVKRTRGDQFEIDLHDLWFSYYQASKYIGADSPNQYRLVFELLQAQAIGPLVKCGEDGEEKEAITSDGSIWRDLPFFTSDMTAFWVTGFATMSTTQRLSFSSFLAKLASLGVVDDRLCGIGLHVLREALETPRALGVLRLEGNDDEDPNRTTDQLSIGALLPVANLWLFHAGIKITQLSHQSWGELLEDLGSPGSLLVEDNLARKCEASRVFSPSRWVFWLKRLCEISQEAKEAGRDDLAEFSGRVKDNMLGVVDQLDTDVLKEAKAAGFSDEIENPGMLLG